MSLHFADHKTTERRVRALLSSSYPNTRRIPSPTEPFRECAICRKTIDSIGGEAYAEAAMATMTTFCSGCAPMACSDGVGLLSLTLSRGSIPDPTSPQTARELIRLVSEGLIEADPHARLWRLTADGERQATALAVAAQLEED